MGGLLSSSARRGRALQLLAGGGFCALVLLLVVQLLKSDEIARYAWERTRWPFLVSLSNDPRFLFDAGTYYLDAASGNYYDFERAEQLLSEAVEADPSLDYGFHQLARVAFLRGDFEKALAYIDLQVAQHGGRTPNSYYVRGLIKGFMGDYSGAATDYRTYRQYDATNWAAAADLAWVLLRDGRSEEALSTIGGVLPLWPNNPWLLNSKAIALYEMGHTIEAWEAIRAATEAVQDVTPEEWLRAYPGNDPLVAAEAVEVFRRSVLSNMHTITLARANLKNYVQ